MQNYSKLNNALLSKEQCAVFVSLYDTGLIFSISVPRLCGELLTLSAPIPDCKPKFYLTFTKKRTVILYYFILRKCVEPRAQYVKGTLFITNLKIHSSVEKLLNSLYRWQKDRGRKDRCFLVFRRKRVKPNNMEVQVYWPVKETKS
jgi:hypothetical protein